MAEIKSTLDLILEKTKNLTMTDEERQTLRLQEWQAKARGWIQHYLTGFKNVAEIRDDLANLPSDQDTFAGLLKKAALSHIRPAEANERILTLLHEIDSEDAKRVSRLLESFQKNMKRQTAGHLQGALEDLATRGVRGSAVLPNLDGNAAWEAWLTSAEETFRKALETGDNP